VLVVSLRSTPVRQPSGSLLAIGRRNAMMHSTEVKADDGAVFRRNANGVYFQVDDDSVIAGWAVRRFAYLHAVFAALRRFLHLVRSGAGRRCKKRSNKNFENVKNVKRDKYKKTFVNVIKNVASS